MERDKDEHAIQHEKEVLESKSTKSTRKKKAASGKKSKKKKSKQEPQSDKFESVSASLDAPGTNQIGEGEGSERLEKAKKVGDSERDDGVRGRGDEKFKNQHSMSRSRSGSGNRFSSLFRRKKRCKSETDLRKDRDDTKNEGDDDGNRDGEEGKQTENPRRRGKRHVSAEDLKRKQPQKSNLKQPSPYREFSPKTQPRDRLQHMTLREVAKEQRERRSESVPRRRKEYVSFNDMDDPMSSPSLSASPMNPGDHSPEFLNSQTLPRDSSRYASLTPQHSSLSNISPPSNNTGSGAPSPYSIDSDRLQRPSDNIMESSQDSGVVALGKQQLRRDSSVIKQEKTSMEKLLELKQNFPHAFSYDGEKDITLKNKQKEENEKTSAHSKSSGDNRNEVPNDIHNAKLDPINANPPPQSDNSGGKTSSSLHNGANDYQALSNTNQTTSESNTPQSSHSTDTTIAPTTTTTTQHATPTRQQSYPATKITSSPSFLAPYNESGERSGASSRVTSMTSSHRSSDLGYVDGDDSVPGDDDDDDDDDDNSAFSTPPEDLISENHKHKSYIHPEMLEKYLSSVLQNNAGQIMPPPDIDIYESDRGKKVYPNATLPSSSRKMVKPYQTYEVRKASRNLQRSSSDVIDRRHKTPPKNHSGTILVDDHSTHPKTPVGSVDTLSDVSLGNLKADGINLSSTKEDVDGDRASLTSTGTLTHSGTVTHSDGKTLAPPVSPDTIPNKDEKPTDIKSVPVMGTTAQNIYRRNFSPLRTRKMYLPDMGSPQESLKKAIEPRSVQQLIIPKSLIPGDSPPGSFQPIASPEEDFSINASAFKSIDKGDKYSRTETGLGKDDESQDASTLGNESINGNSQPADEDLSMQNKDKELSPQPTPTYLFTGLELHTKSPMSKKVNSLVDCLNDQSVLAQRKEEKRKISVRKKKKAKQDVETSPTPEGELKDVTDEQRNECLEVKPEKIETKLVSLKDQECQTPPWLLDDLIASKTEPTKKSKGILGRRKKQSVHLSPFATSQSTDKKDSLETPITSISVSPSTASTGDGVYITPPTTADNDRDLVLRLDAPIPTDSGGISIISPGSSKQAQSNDNGIASDDFKDEAAPSDPSKGAVAKPMPKSKPLSLSAVILLKNRIKNYRDKKKEKKEAAAGNKLEDDVKTDPESPTDTFMMIENEINLSKLEVSRETDILDADYFEPEFSLDYSKKQIRFEDITPPNEPVQSEEPLPPLPPTATRRLRQRRESTMREKRRKCLSYCKRFVAFLFSHIGLCSLVVAYTILGGFIFRALESEADTTVKTDIKTKRYNVLGQIISMAIELDNSEEGVFNLTSMINSTLLKWQADIYHATKDHGWDGTEKMGNEGVWSFASSLLYAITVTTTIGYGHVAPKTIEGRLVTIGYAVVGIPLTLLCLTNIGDVMATGFRLLYGKVCCGICCTMFKPRRRRIPPDLEKGLGRTMITSEKEESDKPKEVIHVPTSLCLLLIAAYIFAGAMLFSMWEKWDIMTGSYFCFITLSTIGFGDIVPGMEQNAWSGEEKLVLCALYLVLGLSLIAMCFNLVQEDVKTKCRWLGMKLGIVDKPETPM